MKNNMKTFIGIKIVMAKPMTAETAEVELQRKLTTENAIPDEEGCHPGYLVEYPDGYRSWSPKKQFEEAYSHTPGGLTFGLAIEAMKAGKKVARKGWNGKGMFLWLLPAAMVKREWCKDPLMLEVCGDRAEFECLGAIRMKTATGEVLTGWLASQTDMLAEDWEIIGAPASEAVS